MDAGDYYNFPTTYFNNLKRALGDRLHLCTVHSPTGEPASAGLFTRHNGIVQFHLSGSARQHRHLSPSKLMLFDMIMWAKSRGDRVVHLGGGVGSQKDSLFDFKAGFSNSRSHFETIRIVTDERRYSYCAELDEKNSGMSAGDAFFPGYRSSLHARQHYDRTHAVT